MNLYTYIRVASSGNTGAEILFPYPSQAGTRSVVICNYSGKVCAGF
jgi:hypothetical protein